jgi:hypothetical protein
MVAGSGEQLFTASLGTITPHGGFVDEVYTLRNKGSSGVFHQHI